ncbi:Sodium Bile acid symporter family protein [Pirellulimonas nuda]|uniref:Sodium Bile acid symporter family protein n=1 Tax=Pirellulimonas nuda TaxID=2528009 RepID=A0A518DG14_9BACT|nr:bile acid:sodium symporter family protein [Pirellulimonas nuda]QDU90414.1 Sodium Bile acid symporter family protein [Pirellulimonas nuda]
MIPDWTHRLERVCLGGALLAVIGVAVGFATQNAELWRTSAICSAVAFAVGVVAIRSLRPFQFTAWIVAAVVAAMLAPWVFRPFPSDSANYKLLLLVLIQAVMFGMGTQMSLRDFAGVARQPWPVAVGLVCQFTIMPLVGFGLAILFDLPPELAAGMVLIGSCSSGLSSNVMAYIARADLALSITLTAIATLLAPVVTPFWMWALASTFLEGTSVVVSFVGMMASIIKIVAVPIGAALIHDYLKHASPAGRRVIWGLALLGVAAPIAWHAGVWPRTANSSALYVELLMWVLGAFSFGTLYHRATLVWESLDRWMPAVAMAGIICVTGMTTAEGREYLFAVGATLVAAAALHNVLGFGLGYWASRALGMDRQAARTIAFEVGMQNGGMATGLAVAMGKLGSLGLPAAIFIAWMNVSGSLLANFWRRRPVSPSLTDVEADETQ